MYLATPEAVSRIYFLKNPKALHSFFKKGRIVVEKLHTVSNSLLKTRFQSQVRKKHFLKFFTQFLRQNTIRPTRTSKRLELLHLMLPKK